MSDERRRQDKLRALAHPVRLRMLSLLTGESLSAAELARALAITHANASYHLRLLARAGEVELVGVDEVRGGRARRYRAPTSARRTRSASPASDEVPGDHLLVYEALAEELLRRGRESVRTGRQTLTDAELWVTPAQWRAFVGDVSAASLRLHEAARPAGTRGTRRTSTTIAAFVMSERDVR